ncbi:MAG: cell surface protein SprA, partial [Candidatus Neomarinimicrobiota bacterium]
MFKRLELDKDYYADLNLGYFRLATQVQESEIIGVVFRIVDQNGNTIKDGEYGDWDRSEFDTTNIVLKLIKPEQMVPSNPCWDLEFKNVYFLGATGINPEGFDLKIVYVHGKTGDEDRAEEDGETFLQKFGLDSKDQNGNLVPDDILDIDNGAIINLQLGELWLPFLRPFQYGENDNSGERNPNLSDKYNCSAMYDSNKTMHSEITADSKFKIVYKYENRSSTINLGPMVIEGSENVTLGNQTLTRGVDYTIDYFSGTLTLLRQEALNPDANIDIKYEKNQFFQLDKKTILGTRAQYDFGDNSYIGGTALYFSKSVIDEKVDIGYEPMRNFVWDLNSRVSRKLNFLTQAVDWLPLIKTDQQSSISFEGEIAQVLPNPNTISNDKTGDPNGVGFIDDFEGAKRITSPPIMRRYWSLASSPLDENGEPKDESQRGFTFWYNPFGGIPTKNIWPNKEVSVRAQNNITEVLNMTLDPKWSIGAADGSDPKEAWGGITYYFPTSYYDQSKTKFIEIWIKGDSGHFHIDLGQISEEVVLDGKLSTEDKPEAGFTMGNDLLDLPGEDTGIDGLFDEDEFIVNTFGDTIRYGSDSLKIYNRNPLDPHSDNWKWKEGSTDYRYINGTEGNSKDVNGLYPDTEDRNSNYVLDRVNDYYTVDFYLDDDNNDYIAGRTLSNKTPTGWKLYRIPLCDFQKAKTGGDVTWQTIRACRLWIDGVTDENSIWIAKIEMVGNEWEEMGIAEDENSDFVKKEGEFAVTVINTEDNPDIYNAPKGVQGEYDRINELRMKEQSLVLSIEGPEGLKPGELCAAKKVLLEESSFITYKKMKLFINGHNLQTRNHIYTDGEKTPLQFFIRFGRSGQNPQYYEYRQPVYPGWYKMEIDLDFITRLKSYNSEEDYPNKDVRPKEYRIIRNEAGEIIKRHYREVEDGKYTGEEVIIYGSPALSRVQQIEVGLKNQKYALDDYNHTEPRDRLSNSVFGQVWLDELRLSEVRRDPGVAYRSKASLKIADLANINISVNRKDADFHTVERRPSLKASGLNTSRNLRVQGSMSIHKFTPNSWGLKIPVSGSYSENVSTPKFIPGTDILSGDTPPDSILTISRSYGFNTSFSKSPSDFWVTKYTIDQISVGFNAQWKNGSSVNVRESESENYSGKFSYKIPFGRDNYVQPLKWMSGIPILGSKFSESHWYYTPSKLEFSMDVAESKSSNIPRVGEPKKPNYDMGLNRNFNFGYKFFDNL